jgi:hypothetical protein
MSRQYSNLNSGAYILDLATGKGRLRSLSEATLGDWTGPPRTRRSRKNYARKSTRGFPLFRMWGPEMAWRLATAVPIYGWNPACCVAATGESTMCKLLGEAPRVYGTQSGGLSVDIMLASYYLLVPWYQRVDYETPRHPARQSLCLDPAPNVGNTCAGLRRLRHHRPHQFARGSRSAGRPCRRDLPGSARAAGRGAGRRSNHTFSPGMAA